MVDEIISETRQSMAKALKRFSTKWERFVRAGKHGIAGQYSR